MATTTRPLRDLLKYVDEGNLVLPEIQRDFVWRRPHVERLFDSLYRGLPIGHMLIWKTKAGVVAKSFAKGEKIKAKGQYGFLLDGQQRLTALRLVRDDHDEFPLGFYLWPDDESAPHANRFFWWRSAYEGDPWALEVHRVLRDDFSASEVIDRLKAAGRECDFDRKLHEDRVYASIQRLRGILDYSVGITEYESDDYAEATELFVRFNSTGRKLNRFDLALSELAIRVPSIVSAGMAEAASKHGPRFVFTRPFLVQCLLAVLTSRQKLKEAATIWAETPEKHIRQAWTKTEKGLARTVELLSGTMHWDSQAWIPSLIGLIPLVYTLAHGGTPSQADRLAARKYLALTGLRKHFSGAGYNEIDRLLARVRETPSPSALLAASKSALGKVRPDDFDTRYRGGAAMALFISMLREDDARDWLHRTPLNGAVVGHNAELQVHHFFPQALLRRHGYGSNRINTFGNYTIINKQTNLGIGADEPADYIPRLLVPEAELEAQAIPLDPKLWRVDNYEAFLNARARLLAARANEYLG